MDSSPGDRQNNTNDNGEKKFIRYAVFESQVEFDRQSGERANDHVNTWLGTVPRIESIASGTRENESDHRGAHEH
jgi:hypothetical protein